MLTLSLYMQSGCSSNLWITCSDQSYPLSLPLKPGCLHPIWKHVFLSVSWLLNIFFEPSRFSSCTKTDAFFVGLVSTFFASMFFDKCSLDRLIFLHLFQIILVRTQSCLYFFSQVHSQSVYFVKPLPWYLFTILTSPTRREPLVLPKVIALIL